MRLIVVLLLMAVFLIFSLTNISAACNEGQIDINEGSAEELDQLYGVGPSIAQNIINSRPFSSVDDLIRVNGIGESRLAGIKSQGLACVENEKENRGESNEDVNDSTTSNTNITNNSNIKEDFINQTLLNLSLSDNSSYIKPETIRLNPKDIKTARDSKKTGENYAIYWLISFSILVGILFMLRKRKYKNEFR